MKHSKILAVLLILALLLPAAALADDYSPDLGMTMDDYIIKYNAVQAALGAPYVPMETPYLWSSWEGFRLAWFHADNERKVTILLLSKDPANNRSTKAGLDEIQIFTKSESDFIPLTSVAIRCSTIFAAELFGTSVAPMRIGSIIEYYYENNCLKKGMSAYNTLDEDGKTAVALFHDSTSGYYYFQISSLEAVQ